MKKLALLIPVAALVMSVIMAFAPADKAEKQEFIVPQANKWTLDKTSSNVEFSVVHMVVSSSEGYFKTMDGTMENTKPDFSDAKINFKIDVNSIDTDSESRDKHLKAEDFFNVAKYPAITFVSTSFKPLKGKNYELTGNMTIKDVTKPVVFKVVYAGTVKTDKGAKASFKCTTVIDRFDYNLKWSKTTEAGGLTVGQEVTITAKIDMIEVK